MTDTKEDTNLEMVAIAEGGNGKESRTIKGLHLMSDLNPYTNLSSDTLRALLIHIKLIENNYDQWSTAFLRTLMSKQNNGFIDGT